VYRFHDRHDYPKVAPKSNYVSNDLFELVAPLYTEYAAIAASARVSKRFGTRQKDLRRNNFGIASG
jgi:hypothetical protein